MVAHLYKSTPTRPLYLYDLQPPAGLAGPHPAIVFFLAEAGTAGLQTSSTTRPRHFAARGFVSVLADYRVKQRDQSTPFESVSDARSAMRWVRSHAADLHIDPRKIVASGGSSGGHVAGATAILTEVNDPSDDLSVSPAPDAMVLFNPVLDTTEAGYGAAFIGPRAKELSLTHHVGKGLPPILLLHGTADHTVPFQKPVDFARAVKANGGRCELIPYEGADHGFFNSPNFRKTPQANLYNDILARVDAFLKANGFE